MAHGEKPKQLDPKGHELMAFVHELTGDWTDPIIDDAVCMANDARMADWEEYQTPEDD
jgi:hypothetical protein